jgi:hypothetical protein
MAALVTTLVVGQAATAIADAGLFYADRLVLSSDCTAITPCDVADLEEVERSTVLFQTEIVTPATTIAAADIPSRAYMTVTGRLNGNREQSFAVTFDRDLDDCSFGFVALLGHSSRDNPILLTSAGPVELTDPRFLVVQSGTECK